jgi:hypothetical protein
MVRRMWVDDKEVFWRERRVPGRLGGWSCADEVSGLVVGAPLRCGVGMERREEDEEERKEGG